MDPSVSTAVPAAIDARHSVSPEGRRTLELRLNSQTDHVASVRQAIERFAASNGFEAAAVADIGLTVNEALANVLRHAYAGQRGKPVLITAEYPCGPDPALRIQIRDWGNGVNPATLPARPHDPLRPGGVGLICMRRLMDQITFLPQPDGMLLTMIKRNAPAKPMHSPGAAP